MYRDFYPHVCANQSAGTTYVLRKELQLLLPCMADSVHPNNNLYRGYMQAGICTCLNCGKEFPKGKNAFGKYCSNQCQATYQSSLKVAAWLAGEISGWTGKTRQLCAFVRVYLKRVRGSACSVCGWDKHHPVDGKSLTEVDHVDGNAENCRPGNLQILCPNCHSETATFRARNKSSTRNRS